MFGKDVDEERALLMPTAKFLSQQYMSGSIEYKKLLSEIATNCLESSFMGCGPARNARALGSARFWLDVLECQRNPRIAEEQSPPWLTGQMMSALLSEAGSQKPDLAGAKGPVFGWEVAEATKLLASNSMFRLWAEQRMDRAFSRLEFFYIYYENTGQFCPVHIDLPDLDEYNCLVGLRHDNCGEAGGSAMRFFLPDGNQDFKMIPGSTLLFHGSSTAHGRTALSGGEVVWTLSIGLN